MPNSDNDESWEGNSTCSQSGEDSTWKLTEIVSKYGIVMVALHVFLFLISISDTIFVPINNC